MRHTERSLLALVSVLACSNPNNKRESIDAKQKVTPSELRLSTSSSNPAALWKLFDRSTSQGWLPTEDTLSLEASFEEEATLSALKVFGPSNYRLKLVTASGAVIEAFDLSGLSQGWNQLAFSSPVTLDALTLQFEPLGELSQISEIEFWGDVPSSAVQPGIVPDELAGRAAFVTNGSKEELVLQTESLGGGCAEVEFTLTQSPDAYAETFLSFESWGLLRPSALDLSWNGVSTQEGEWVVAGRSDISKRFTLPIDDSKLVLGKNELRACVPNEAESEVVLSNPVLVGVADSGRSFISQVLVDGETLLPRNDKQDLLLDGDLSSTRNVGRELVLSLNRAVAPDALLLQVQSESAELTSVGCLQASNWKSLGSQSLHRGENLVPLSGKNKACEQLKLIFEGRVVLSEVGLVGSGALERIDWPSFIVTASELFGNDAILQGFLRIPERPVGPIPLTLGQQGLSSLTGRFSEKLGLPADESVPWVTELHATVGQAAVSSAVTFVDATAEMLDAVANQDYDQYQTSRNTLFGNPGEKINRKVSKTEETEIFLGERVGVKVPAGALKVNRKTRSAGDEEESVSVQYLSENALPPLDPLLVNVTPNESGYEFTPHGATFSPAAEITMPYDPTLFPEGLGVNDVKTYFYNEESGKWEELQRLQVDVGDQTVDSSTTHFTIMINAVLSSPENPSVSSYTPTEISSLAAADPGAGIDMIQPPSANNSGSANVSYPLWVPPGRGGFSPSLAVSYSSEGGNGWMGEGWDVRISSIAIDTRYGVPTYAAGEEPRYTLDGESLVPAAKEPNGPVCIEGTSTVSVRYRPRTEGAFMYILRCGTHATQDKFFNQITPNSGAVDPETYHWEVLDKSGTRYFYGTDKNSQLFGYRDVNNAETDPLKVGVYSWHLRKVKDIDGNVTNFNYIKDFKPSTESGENWSQIYPATIEYTVHEGTSPLPAQYKISFLRNRLQTSDEERDSDTQIERADGTSSGRPGFKTMTRFLLRAVRVSFQGDMVRQYLFTYQPSSRFKKSMLTRIEVHGPGGDDEGSPCFDPRAYFYVNCPDTDGNFFYKHDFEYNSEDPGFENAKEWFVSGDALSSEAEQSQQESTGLTGASRVSAGVGGYMGVAAPLPIKSNSSGVQLNLGFGARKELVGFYDINGDSLPDEIYRDGEQLSVLYNQYQPFDTQGQPQNCVPGGDCKFEAFAPHGDLVAAGDRLSVIGLDKLGLDLDYNGSAGLRAFLGTFDVGGSAGVDISTSSRFMTDLNGDGFIDQVKRDEALIARRAPEPGCGADQICYASVPFRTAEKIKLDDDPDIAQIKQELQKNQRQLKAVRKWVAPFGGTVQIDATVKRPSGRNPRTDATAELYFHHPDLDLDEDEGNDGLQDSVLNDLCNVEACPLSIPRFGVGSFATHILSDQEVVVQPGDEIYLLVGVNGENNYENDSPANQLETRLTVTYSYACRESFNPDPVGGIGPICAPVEYAPGLAPHEPTGSQVYVFDSADDFKLAGGAPVPFVAPQTGTISIQSDFAKVQSSDEVLFCVQKMRPSQALNQATNQFELELPCFPNNPFSQNTSSPPYYQNAYSQFMSDSAGNDSHEVEINVEAGDVLVFRVESNFPIDPEEVSWQLSASYTELCDNGNCQALCAEGEPRCTDILATWQKNLQFTEDQFEPFFPQPHLIFAEPRDVFVVPSDGFISVAGEIYHNSELTQEVPPSIFSIRSEHRLIAKQTNEDGSSFAINSIPVTAGESISFDFLAASEFEGSAVIFWDPVVHVDGEPEYILASPEVHEYVQPKAFRDKGKLNIGDYFDPYRGDFHGWSYGAWDTAEPFDPEKLRVEADIPTTIPPQLMKAMLTGNDSGLSFLEKQILKELNKLYSLTSSMSPKHAGSALSDFDPVWYARDLAIFVSKFKMNGARLGDSIRLVNPVLNPESAAELTGDLEPTDQLTPEAFTSPNGASRLSLSFSLSGSANAGGVATGLTGFSTGGGYSRTKIDAVDINGDGILDQLKHDGWYEGTFSDVEPPLHPIDNTFLNEAISSNESFNYGLDFGIGGGNAKGITQLVNAAGRLMGVTTNFEGASNSLGASVNLSRSISRRDLMDVNGDGLPDRVVDRTNNGLKVNLNLGGFFGADEIWPLEANGDWVDEVVDTFNPEGTTGVPTQASTRVLNHTTARNLQITAGASNPAFGASLTANFSTSRTVVSTADINGDGLIDLVLKREGTPMKVQFNLGNRFSSAQEITTPVWDEEFLPTDFTPNIPEFNVAPDSGVINFLSQLSGPDVISGTGFYTTLKPLGITAGASATFPVPVWPLPPIFLLYELQASFGIDTDTYELTLADVDGDGAPDHVLRRGGSDFRPGGRMFVKHNKSDGKENLLKEIHGPLGATISMEYKRTANTVKDPNNHIVLASITVDDGHSFGAASVPVYCGDGHETQETSDPFDSPSYKTLFEYTNGFYDRNEKEFFGFATVTSTRPDCVETVQEFHNEDYNLKGLLAHATTYAPDGIEKFSESFVTYETRLEYDGNPDPEAPIQPACVAQRHPLLSADSCDVNFTFAKETISRTYEGSLTAVKESHSKDLNYDRFGNLLASIDFADDATPNDNILAKVTYKTLDNVTANWLVSLPEQIRVCAPLNDFNDQCNGSDLRRRTGDYDARGNLLALTTLLDTDNSTATSTFEYDEFGNLTKVKAPAVDNYLPDYAPANNACPTTVANQTQQEVIYTYDTTVTAQFLESVKNSFNLSSSAVYDKRFGVVLETTDSNLQKIQKSYDGFGRLITVRSPFNLNGSGLPESIKMEYFPHATIPRAVTTHNVSAPAGYNDADYTAQGGKSVLHTVTFTDGLDRAIQVKKTARVDQNGVILDGMLMQKPPKYDRVGRAVKSYHPFFVPFSMMSLLSALTTISAPPTPIDDFSSDKNETTTVVYDSRDRVKETHYPDGVSSSTQYLIAQYEGHNQFKTISTDELGRQAFGVTDGVGRALSITEPAAIGSGFGAQTKYTYLRTGEISTIVDTQGNTTALTYDLRGLWKTMNNPDTGLISQEYNKLGALVRRTEPNHVGTAGIQYKYDRGRLLCVDYPNRVVNAKQDVLYEYGANTLANANINISKGLAGRIKSVKDETGKQSFEYGALGETKQVTRDLNESMFDPGPGKPTSNQNPNLVDQVMRMESDSFGRMLSMTYPDGEKLLYSYDPAGNLNTMKGRYVVNNANVDRFYLRGVSYDKFGNKTSVTSGNDVTSTFSYDPKRVRLKTAVVKQSNGTKLSDLTYTYDSVGNPKTMHSEMPAFANNGNTAANNRAGFGDWTFGYDNLDRLTSAHACQDTAKKESTSYDIGFEYDSIHNITLKQKDHKILKNISCSGAISDEPKENNFGYEYRYTPGKPHRLRTILDSETGVTTEFSYDPSGNLINKSGDIFTWDDANRMSRANVSGSQNDLLNRYDAGGTRTLKQSQNYGSTLFISQYFDVRVKNNNRRASKHFFAGATRIASETIDFNPVTEGAGTANGTQGTQLFFHQDHLGSTSIVTGSTGAALEYLQYFADGDVWIDKNQTAPENGYKFSGKFFDPETGLYDFGARFYDPKTSLWLGVDPELAGAHNIDSILLSTYSYANNNSIKNSDPDGRRVPTPLTDLKTNEINQLDTEIKSEISQINDLVLKIKRFQQTKNELGKTKQDFIDNEDQIAFNEVMIKTCKFELDLLKKDLSSNFNKIDDLYKKRDDIFKSESNLQKFAINMSMNPSIISSPLAMAAGKIIPFNGRINVGGGFEAGSELASNLQPAGWTNTTGIKNLVSGSAEDIGQLFESESASLIYSNRLTPETVDWVKFSAGAYDVLKSGGKISMNVWIGGGMESILVQAKKELLMAGFKSVYYVDFGGGAGYIIHAIKP